MPVYSMTGYASGQHSNAPTGAPGDAKAAGASRLGLEIRSVNSRFLDLSFRLGEELRQHEPLLREMITARLKRGKVEVRAALESAGADTLREPTPRMLQRLGSMQDNVRAWIPDASPLSVADVIRLGASDANNEIDWAEVIGDLAKRTLDELMAAREREGVRLADMFLGHLR
jgi:uncharacterized protein (TIGR00255 family)